MTEGGILAALRMAGVFFDFLVSLLVFFLSIF